MKKLFFLVAFLTICGYASAQSGQNDWDKTTLNDFGFYNQYIIKYKQKIKFSWDEKKFPWNHPDRTWTNILLPWGNVGIGTLTPDEKLHVIGNVRIDGLLSIPRITADTLLLNYLTVTEDIWARRNIIIDGNIGIGVRNPAQKLDIAGSLKVSHSIFADSVIIKALRTTSGSFANVNIFDRFLVSGKTGLGVASPAERLEVDGNIKTTQNLMAAQIIADTATFAKGVKVNGTISTNIIYTNAIKLSGAQSLSIDNNINFAGSAIMNQTLAIGTPVVPFGYLMAVKGKIIAEEIKVRHFDTWPDYVFGDSYKLKSLYEVEQYLKQNNHLEGMPSAKQAESEGIEVGEMQAKLLEKIEELTLYLIELKKENDKLAQKVTELEKK